METGVRMLEDGKGFKFTNALNEDVEVEGGSGAKWSPANVRCAVLCWAVQCCAGLFSAVLP